MLAAVNFMTSAAGGDVLLLAWSGCTAVYLVCGLFRRKKRNERRRLVIGLLAAELLVDMFCFLVFFPGGEYHNWGIGGAYAAVLWPLALLTAYVLTAVFEPENA